MPSDELRLSVERRKLVILKANAAHAMALDAIDIVNRGESVSPAQLADLVRRVAEALLIIVEEAS